MVRNLSITRAAYLLLLMCVVSALCVLPCMSDGIAYGDDIAVHMLRVESMYDALATGQGYPAYVYQLMLGGSGYGMGLFYPDIWLLPAVGFRFLGASPELAMKLYICVLMLATCASSYYAGHVFGGRYTGLVSMLLYVMGHYHLQDIYRRGAMGEAVAMIFIPLAVAGLYDFTEKGHEKKGLLCFAFTGLILAHTISFVLCVIMGAAWTLLRIRKVWKTKRAVYTALGEAFACAALTCYYWLPMLEQFAGDSFGVSESPAFYTSEDVMNPLDILCGRYSISFAEVGILALLICLGLKYRKNSRTAKWCMALICALFAVQMVGFLWELVDKTPLVSIQFPWRLNMLTEWFAALGIASAAAALCEESQMTRKVLAMSVSGFLLVGIMNLNIVWQVEIQGYRSFGEGYTDDAAAAYDVGYDEWLPSNEGSEAETMDGTYKDDGSYECRTEGSGGSFLIPKYYYKGYAAVLEDAEGCLTNLTVSKDEATGYIRVESDGTEGTLRVYYKGTTVQRISLAFSVLALLAVCGCKVAAGRRRVC